MQGAGIEKDGHCKRPRKAPTRLAHQKTEGSCNEKVGDHNWKRFIKGESKRFLHDLQYEGKEEFCQSGRDRFQEDYTQARCNWKVFRYLIILDIDFVETNG